MEGGEGRKGDGGGMPFSDCNHCFRALQDRAALILGSDKN